MNTAVVAAPEQPAVTTWRLPVQGMTCASCVARVEKALRKVPGVLQAQVNLATEQARVKLADDRVDLLVALGTSAGYGLSAQPVADRPRRRPCGGACASPLTVEAGVQDEVERAGMDSPGPEEASGLLSTEVVCRDRRTGT